MNEEIYYEKLAHVVMEAELSHDLLARMVETQERWGCDASLSPEA